MRGYEQPLLGQLNAQRLDIIQMNMKGVEQKEDRVARCDKLNKAAVETGIESGGQAQEEIDRKRQSITDKLPDMFTGQGPAKV